MPAPRTARFTVAAQPYPGLRPFDVNDAYLFFGREQHTSELLDRLSRNRFLAVVGTSGSGKSSLVRAGLLPALFRGYMAATTSRWKIAVMRPGGGPVCELASALAESGALGGNAADYRAALAQSTLGLVSVVKAANLQAGESLLVVVDQFEELFRFAAESRSTDSAGDAMLFVASLLEAADQYEVPIYVALTMRTDYLGDCTAFPGLPEALNRSQYLIPRLSREQRKDAIEKPIELCGAEITPRLVQQILNDMGDDPDQLPVMQHALARMYRIWKTAGGNAPLDLDDYNKAGKLEAALNDHAEAVYGGFNPSRQEWTRKLFRCLTKTERGRRIRRAGGMGRIFRVMGAESAAAQAEVLGVIEVFAAQENSFLFVTPAEQAGDRIVDISHESLIRKWRTLTGWVKEEAASAEEFSDLSRDTAKQAAGEKGYWVQPELGRVLAHKRSDGWTPAWAEQYSQPGSPSFADVERFLEASKARDRRRKVYQYAAFAVGMIALGAVAWALDEHNHNQALELENAQIRSDQKLGQLQDISKKLNTTTDANQRKHLEEQFTMVGASLQKEIVESKHTIESLRQENKLLQEKAAKTAPPQDKAARVEPPEPAKHEEDAHVNEIASLKQQVAQRVSKEEVDGLKKQLEDVDKRRNELEQQVGSFRRQLREFLPPAPVTPPRSDPKPSTPQAGGTDTVPKPIVVPMAPSAARESVTITNDTAMHLKNKGLTLVTQHMGFAPSSADLYVFAGPTAAAIGPFSNDRSAGDALLNPIRNANRGCKGTPFDYGGNVVWCFHVERIKIDTKTPRPQNLGTVTVGNANYLFFATELNPNAHSVNLTISVER